MVVDSMTAFGNKFQKLIQHHVFSVTRGGNCKASTIRQFHSARDGINSNNEASERSRTSNPNRKEGGPTFPPPNKGLRGHWRSDCSPQNNRSNFKQETRKNDIFGEKNFNNSGDKSPRRSTSHINSKDVDGEERMDHSPRSNLSDFRRERMKNDRSDNSFLEKFMLSSDKKVEQNSVAKAPIYGGGILNAKNEKIVEGKVPAPPEDAEQIFKQMKETGLIPNAVAMLDGLCKDGLVQQAMDLFRTMREKGNIPEVVVYTAVVEGFCKAHKVDDANRIFRKMQSLGIVPNAFSYTVIVQGMYNCGRVEDAVEYCEEMIDAGHSPNVATFVGLVNEICSREKKNQRGVEAAKDVVNRLTQKGLVINEKSVSQFLDKKAPFSPELWEAILGQKTSSSSSVRVK